MTFQYVRFFVTYSDQFQRTAGVGFLKSTIELFAGKRAEV